MPPGQIEDYGVIAGRQLHKTANIYDNQDAVMMAANASFGSRFPGSALINISHVRVMSIHNSSLCYCCSSVVSLFTVSACTSAASLGIRFYYSTFRLSYSHQCYVILL